jgi:hypothetical protein
MRYRTPFLWPFKYANIPDITSSYAPCGDQDLALLLHSQVKSYTLFISFSVMWYPGEVYEFSQGLTISLVSTQIPAYTAGETHYGWYYSGVSGEYWPDAGSRLSMQLSELQGALKPNVHADVTEGGFPWPGPGGWFGGTGCSLELRLSQGGIACFSGNAGNTPPNNGLFAEMNHSGGGNVLGAVPLYLEIGAAGRIQAGTITLVKVTGYDINPPGFPDFQLQKLEATLVTQLFD